ncbi:MAG: TolC family protein [Candidatus Cloacimonetes bacterium]|nr:TolC family protein [Candidatus Cloacimonadota bacterium]
MLKTKFNPDFSGKKTIILILLCFLNLLLIAEEITLFDCIDAALVNSYEIKNAEQNVKIYRSENLNKLFDFIPEITAYANAKYDIDGNDIRTNNISVSENLYLFDERFSNYKLSCLDFHNEKLNYQQQKQSTVLEILQLYSEILILKESLDYYLNYAEFYDNESEFVKEMIKTGKRTVLDLYSTQIEQKNAELNITKTQNDIEKKLLELSQKTGRGFKKETMFSNINNLLPTEIGIISYENNLDWKMSNFAKKRRKIEKNIYLKRIFPDLYVNGYYNWRNIKYWKDAEQTYDYEGNFIIRDQETKYWELSLNLSYSLGSFAQKLNDFSISKRRLKQEELNFNSLQQELQKELASKKLDLKLKQDEIKICIQKFALAEKKLFLIQERFRHGLISFLDFKTTFNETLNAKIELLQTRYDYIIAFAKWQIVKGEKIFGRY